MNSVAFLETGAVHNLVGEEGEGGLMPFLNVRGKDMVFRSAYAENAMVFGNTVLGEKSDSATAALYIEDNRVGVRKLPRFGAALDVSGTVMCTGGRLELRSETQQESHSTDTIANLSHSNIDFRIPDKDDDGKATPSSAHFARAYVDARGVVRSGAFMCTDSCDGYFVPLIPVKVTVRGISYVDGVINIRLSLSSAKDTGLDVLLRCDNDDDDKPRFDRTLDRNYGRIVLVIGETAYALRRETYIYEYEDGDENGAPDASLGVDIIPLQPVSGDRKVFETAADPVLQRCKNALESSSDPSAEYPIIDIRPYVSTSSPSGRLHDARSSHYFSNARPSRWKYAAASAATRVFLKDEEGGAVVVLGGHDARLRTRMSSLLNLTVAIGSDAGLFVVEDVLDYPDGTEDGKWAPGTHAIVLRAFDGTSYMAQLAKERLENAVSKSDSSAMPFVYAARPRAHLSHISDESPASRDAVLDRALKEDGVRRLVLVLDQLGDVSFEEKDGDVDEDGKRATLKFSRTVFSAPLHDHLNRLIDGGSTGNYVRSVRFARDALRSSIPVLSSHVDDDHVYLGLSEEGSARVKSAIEHADDEGFLKSPVKARFDLSGHPVEVEGARLDTPHHLTYLVRAPLRPSAREAIVRAWRNASGSIASNDDDYAGAGGTDLLIADGGGDRARQWIVTNVFWGSSIVKITVRRKDGHPLTEQEKEGADRKRVAYVEAFERVSPQVVDHDDGVEIHRRLVVRNEGVGHDDDKALEDFPSSFVHPPALEVRGDVVVENGGVSFRDDESAWTVGLVGGRSHERGFYDGFEVGFEEGDDAAYPQKRFGIGGVCRFSADGKTSMRGELRVSNHVTAHAYQTTCDERIKTDISDVAGDDALALATGAFALPLKRFRFRDENLTSSNVTPACGEVRIGATAQDVLRHLPMCVKTKRGRVPLLRPFFLSCDRDGMATAYVDEDDNGSYLNREMLAPADRCIFTVGRRLLVVDENTRGEFEGRRRYTMLVVEGVRFDTYNDTTGDLLSRGGDAEYNTNYAKRSATLMTLRLRHANHANHATNDRPNPELNCFGESRCFRVTHAFVDDLRIVDQTEMLYTAISAVQALDRRTRQLEDRVHELSSSSRS